MQSKGASVRRTGAYTPCSEVTTAECGTRVPPRRRLSAGSVLSAGSMQDAYFCILCLGRSADESEALCGWATPTTRIAKLSKPSRLGLSPSRAKAEAHCSRRSGGTREVGQAEKPI
jgi:hypothetical protein